DRLFATLDPTTRRVEGVAPLVLSDTVGFVRDLPHELVAAFRSTLSEARDADLLLHVVDAADEHRDERILQVDAVLAEIGAGDIPQLLVFNKIDRLEDMAPRRDPEMDGRERVWLSARTGEGLDLLRDALAERFLDRCLAGELDLGPADGRLRARLHAAGAVKAEESRDQGGWHLRVELPRAVAERLAAEPGGQALQPLLLVAPPAPTYNPRTHRNPDPATFRPAGDTELAWPGTPPAKAIRTPGRARTPATRSTPSCPGSRACSAAAVAGVAAARPA